MSVIIRLQNLPWSANAHDIREFFTGLSIPEGGVHIVGGEDGDAFIAFSSDEDARLAMRKSGTALKGIQVSLLLSSRNEMQTVIESARQQALGLQAFAATPTPVAIAPQASMQVPHPTGYNEQMAMAQANPFRQQQPFNQFLPNQMSPTVPLNQSLPMNAFPPGIVANNGMAPTQFFNQQQSLSRNNAPVSPLVLQGTRKIDSHRNPSPVTSQSSDTHEKNKSPGSALRDNKDRRDRSRDERHKRTKSRSRSRDRDRRRRHRSRSRDRSGRRRRSRSRDRDRGNERKDRDNRRSTRERSERLSLENPSMLTKSSSSLKSEGGIPGLGEIPDNIPKESLSILKASNNNRNDEGPIVSTGEWSKHETNKESEIQEVTMEDVSPISSNNGFNVSNSNRSFDNTIEPKNPSFMTDSFKSSQFLSHNNRPALLPLATPSTNKDQNLSNWPQSNTNSRTPRDDPRRRTEEESVRMPWNESHHRGEQSSRGTWNSRGGHKNNGLLPHPTGSNFMPNPSKPRDDPRGERGFDPSRGGGNRPFGDRRGARGEDDRSNRDKNIDRSQPTRPNFSSRMDEGRNMNRSENDRSHRDGFSSNKVPLIQERDQFKNEKEQFMNDGSNKKDHDRYDRNYSNPTRDDFNAKEKQFVGNDGYQLPHGGHFPSENEEFHQEEEIIPPQENFNEFPLMQNEFSRGQEEFNPGRGNFQGRRGKFHPAGRGGKFNEMRENEFHEGEDNEFPMRHDEFPPESGEEFNPGGEEFPMGSEEFDRRGDNFRSGRGAFHPRRGDFGPGRGDFSSGRGAFPSGRGGFPPGRGDFHPRGRFFRGERFPRGGFRGRGGFIAGPEREMDNGGFWGRGRGGYARGGGPRPPPGFHSTCVEILHLSPNLKYKAIRDHICFHGFVVLPNSIKLLADNDGNLLGVALVRFPTPEIAFDVTKLSGTFMYDCQIEVNLIEEYVYDQNVDVRVATEGRMNSEFAPINEFTLDSEPVPKRAPSSCIKVRNLPSNFTENDVLEFFKDFKVNEVVLEYEKASGQPSGSCYFSLETSEEATKCIEEFQGTKFEGKTIEMNICPAVHMELAATEKEKRLSQNSQDRNQNSAPFSSKRDPQNNYPVQEKESAWNSKSMPSRISAELLTDSVVIKNASPDITERSIQDFFSEDGLKPEKIYFNRPDSQGKSDVFVIFPHVDHAKKAKDKNMQILGSKKVSIALISKPNVMKVMGLPFDPVELSRKGASGIKPPQSNNAPGKSMQAVKTSEPPPDFGKPGCVIALSNVPYHATTDDILCFLKDFHLGPENLIRRYDEKNRPTSDARVALNDRKSASDAAYRLNRKDLLGRSVYVDIV